MNTLPKTLVFFFFLLIAISVNAQGKRIYFTEIYGEFLGNLSTNYNGTKTPISSTGAGAHVCVGNQNISSILEFNYKQINLKELNLVGVEKVNVTEFFFGLRYFPMRPTLIIGNVALRYTIGAAYGFDLEPNWRPIYFTGIAITPIREVMGVSINLVYRPGDYTAGGYMLEPAWTIRTAILMGPTPKK